MKRTILLTALVSLLLGPACGSESPEPEAVSESTEAAATPASTAAAPTEAAEAPGVPSMDECISTCEAEHGPIINHGRLSECAQEGLDTDACAHRAINEATNRCQRVCRGMPPELPEHLRPASADGGS